MLKKKNNAWIKNQRQFLLEKIKGQTDEINDLNIDLTKAKLHQKEEQVIEIEQLIKGTQARLSLYKQRLEEINKHKDENINDNDLRGLKQVGLISDKTYHEKIRKPIYCEDCKYVIYTHGWGFSTDTCKKVIGQKDTPERQLDIHASPEEHNRNNKCHYYERPKTIIDKIKHVWEKNVMEKPLNTISETCQCCGKQLYKIPGGWNKNGIMTDELKCTNPNCRTNHFYHESQIKEK